jgi:hypothetical protein
MCPASLKVIAATGRAIVFALGITLHDPGICISAAPFG